MSDDVLSPTPVLPVDTAAEIQKAYDAGLQASLFHASVYDSLQLARITALIDDPKSPGKWSGRVMVQVLGLDATRDNVVVTFPYCGQSGFLGGIPDIETLVVIGWLPGGHPVALGQVPLLLRALEAYKSLPVLVPGEILLRSSLRSPDASNQAPGASMRLDAQGRAVITSANGGVEVSVGAPADTPDTALTVRVTAGADQKMVLLIGVDGTVVLETTSVTIKADEVAIGEGTTPLNELVTRAWVNDVFAVHTHQATPATGPPLPFSDTGLTSRLRSE